MFKYFVNGNGRDLVGSKHMWCVYNDDGECIGLSTTILSAILEADYSSLTWDQAHMIESVIIDIMKERDGKTCRFQ